MCVLVSLAAFSVLRQAVLCIVYDVVILLMLASQQEPSVKKACAPLRVSLSVCVLLYSQYNPHPDDAFLIDARLLGAGGGGTSGTELMMHIGLGQWQCRLERYSCHTGHGVHCFSSRQTQHEQGEKRSEAVGLCVVKLD